jgi:hypothetical protein
MGKRRAAQRTDGVRQAGAGGRSTSTPKGHGSPGRGAPKTMSEIKQQILSAGAANLVGEPFACIGLQNLFLELITELDEADLDASIVLGMGVEGPDVGVTTLPPINFGLALTPAPTGVTYTPATGTIALSNVETGRQSMLIRIASPARVLIPTYTYTSGGGTNPKVRLVAWGWHADT